MRFQKGSEFLSGRLGIVRFSMLFGGYDRCYFCPNQIETSLHILRDCPIASAIWNNLLRSNLIFVFYMSDYHDLLNSNICNSFSVGSNHTWKQIWAMTEWRLWDWRNEALFSNRRLRSFDRCSAILQLVEDYNISKRGDKSDILH